MNVDMLLINNGWLLFLALWLAIIFGSADNWLKITTEFGHLFHGAVGTLQELSCYCEHLNKRRRHFSTSCEYLKVG
ncbi:hypothetical protein HQQ94_17110 [Shewanella sp. VB17]|uniref:hypothetical protein n=1 Tax=Shewanella sp. VB17 TaxID=2739432 RepID=UPI001563F1E0|nr:hypothetical protein [Shewanella sp. VB17]NRD74903.1 hypothetical protein [Shewanella sp. VB17]